jgi:ribosomal protein L24
MHKTAEDPQDNLLRKELQISLSNVKVLHPLTNKNRKIRADNNLINMTTDSQLN